MCLCVFVNEREKAREEEGEGIEEMWENSISVGIHIKVLLNSFFPVNERKLFNNLIFLPTQ